MGKESWVPLVDEFGKFNGKMVERGRVHSPNLDFNVIVPNSHGALFKNIG